MNQPDYTSKSIDHLGLVSALRQELGIAELLHKNILKSTEQSMTSFHKLCRQIFACDQDAEKALERWLKVIQPYEGLSGLL